MPPRARVCYICGRQYMIHSFPIHEAQCRELFEKREALKPPKERRRCPPDPMAGYYNNGSNTAKDIDEMNDISFKAFNDNLEPCDICGRTFLPDRLAIHRRACKPSASSASASASASYSNNNSNIRQSGASNNMKSSSMRSVAGGAGPPDMPLNRGGSGRMNMPPSGFSDFAELIKCQSCGRSFNEISYPK